MSHVFPPTSAHTPTIYATVKENQKSSQTNHIQFDFNAAQSALIGSDLNIDVQPQSAQLILGLLLLLLAHDHTEP